MDALEIAQRIKDRIGPQFLHASQVSLSESVGIAKAQLSRMLRTGHMRLSQACMIADAVGCEIIFDEQQQKKQRADDDETLKEALSAALKQNEWLRSQIDRMQREYDELKRKREVIVLDSPVIRKKD